MYEKKLSEEIVNTFTENIKKRALEISQSNACEKLYNLFVDNGIINERNLVPIKVVTSELKCVKKRQSRSI